MNNHRSQSSRGEPNSKLWSHQFHSASSEKPTAWTFSVWSFSSWTCQLSKCLKKAPSNFLLSISSFSSFPPLLCPNQSTGPVEIQSSRGGGRHSKLWSHRTSLKDKNAKPFIWLHLRSAEGIQLLKNGNVCIKCQGDPSNRCWQASVWTEEAECSKLAETQSRLRSLATIAHRTASKYVGKSDLSAFWCSPSFCMRFIRDINMNLCTQRPHVCDKRPARGREMFRQQRCTEIESGRSAPTKSGDVKEAQNAAYLFHAFIH